MLKINIVNEKMLNADKENIIDLLKENFNNPVLNKLYFIPKKINKNIINTKLNTVEYISKVLKTINFYRHKDIKKLISDKMSRFEKGTSYKINAGKLYIIIGLDTTTIYSINNNITVLLLESTAGIEDKLDILLAHEYTHFIRKQIFKQDIFEKSIGERFITEGIACNYSREIVPNKNDYEYCIVDESIVNWVKKNIVKVEEHMNGKLATNELMGDYFNMLADTTKTGLPARTGYVYGYIKVKDYLERYNLKVKDIIDVDWHEIL